MSTDAIGADKLEIAGNCWRWRILPYYPGRRVIGYRLRFANRGGPRTIRASRDLSGGKAKHETGAGG